MVFLAVMMEFDGGSPLEHDDFWGEEMVSCTL